ncbi:MAG: peroxiredoxin-like family protein [Bacteroidota bacterium]
MKKIFLVAICSIGFALSHAQNTIYPEGLKVGDKAPAIVGKDNSGKTFNLNQQLKKGAVVVIFYRGQWCPFCNKELSYLNDSLAMIAGKGASVVAISPETMQNVEKTVTKTKAAFPIISDSSMTIMKAWNVNFAVDDNTQTRYKKFGLDFMEVNGNNGANLPVPATYIIGKDGNIKYVFFNPDYKKRASVKDILEHL